MVAAPAIPGDFTLAASPLASTRLAALAYIAAYETGPPELGEALGVHRVHALRVLRQLETLGMVEPCGRKLFRITPKGVGALQEFAAELGLIIRSIREFSAVHKRSQTRF